MPKRFYIFVLTLLLPYLGAAADTGFLPAQFGNWQAQGPARTVALAQLTDGWTKASGAALVAQEAGLTKIEERSYRRGDDELLLRAFQLKDPSGAYEFYTFGLEPGMKSSGVGDHAVLNNGDARLLSGNLVIQAVLGPKIAAEELSALLPTLKGKIDPTPLPPLLEYLPRKGLLLESERYSLGPQGFRAALTSVDQAGFADVTEAVGFNDSAEVVVGKFASGKDAGVLLLIEYPTPNLAEKHLHHIQDALPASAPDAGVKVVRKASILSLVLGAARAEFAEELREAVNYETHVTWNEPHQTATDPPIFSVMAKIFIFTGIFLAVATVLGIAFGGVRVLLKRLYPGKIFDRPEQIEVLQMGLTGKKIDPTDMY